MSVLLIALSFTLADEDAAAKKLFDSVEKKVQSAKSLKLKFAGELKEGERGFTLNGSLLLGPGNKMNLAVKAKMGDKDQEMSAISDGKNVVLTQRGTPKTDPVPEGYTKKIQENLFRLGPTLTTITAVQPPSSKRKPPLFEVSDYALGKTEKLGKRESKILSYKLTLGKKQMQVKVWIDAKTKLPVKRILRPLAEDAKRGGYVEETMTFTLNPKVDEKSFVLPK